MSRLLATSLAAVALVVTTAGLASAQTQSTAPSTHGGTKLRYSSITGTDHHIAEGEYIPYKGINDIYPEKLIDVTAWTLAALVLGVSNEPAGAQAADKRASEILSLL